jgi:hypothetical protein
MLRRMNLILNVQLDSSAGPLNCTAKGYIIIISVVLSHLYSVKFLRCLKYEMKNATPFMLSSAGIPLSADILNYVLQFSH